MMKKLIIKQNFYKDSIALMSITTKVNQLEGVIQSSIGMATPINKTIIEDIGFNRAELDNSVESDMLIALELENESYLESVLTSFESFLVVKQDNDDVNKQYTNTKQAILELTPNLAVISIPGNYAYREVKTCLENNMHVMLFSDNMSIEEEKKLKEYASSKDLLLMGPDCGTAIINGIGLCFANKVAKGNIGIVGASGTGIQEASVLIDRYGAGITHAIGTGGRDLSEYVGGIMMLKGLELMQNDDETEIILLISKQPSSDVAEKILAKVKESTKKCVVCFINGKVTDTSIDFVATLEEAAMRVASLSLGKTISINYDKEKEIINTEIKKSTNGCKYLRALYCGGTLAAESDMIIGENLKVYSNVTKNPDNKLKDPFKSNGHTIVDLGDDLFTEGKPHPMIDPTIRNDRIIQEASCSDVAVMILDFELGYGSSENPVGLTLPSIKKALELAKTDNRHLTIICYVLTTNNEKQNVSQQLQMLQDLDVVTVDSNAQAARIAKEILSV
jgi:FdrA protein